MYSKGNPRGPNLWGLYAATERGGNPIGREKMVREARERFRERRPSNSELSGTSASISFQVLVLGRLFPWSACTRFRVTPRPVACSITPRSLTTMAQRKGFLKPSPHGNPILDAAKKVRYTLSTRARSWAAPAPALLSLHEMVTPTIVNMYVLDPPPLRVVRHDAHYSLGH